MSLAAVTVRRPVATQPSGEAPRPLLTDAEGPDDPERQRRLESALLLKRTFAVDVLVCARCSGPMRLVAMIDEGPVAQKILSHLGLPTQPPGIPSSGGVERSSGLTPPEGRRGRGRRSCTSTSSTR